MARVIRKDLIAEISDKTGVKHQDVARIVDAFLDGLVDHLGQGRARRGWRRTSGRAFRGRSLRCHNVR